MITYEALVSVVTKKTKLLILNYPNNPTGRILRPSELQALRRFLLEYPNIYVISDEIYEKVVFDGNEIVSIASDPLLFHRVVVINGFSKCSAMTGWRVGYLACNPELYQIILKIFQHSMSCTSGFLQKAALVALDCTDEMEQMRKEYEKRRKILVDGIAQIPGVEFIAPGGAFYAWVRFDTEKDSETICTELLEQAKIAGIPGSAYGEEEVCCVRFSFATSEDEIREMVERLKIFVKNNQKVKK
jgi:aspartate aminotransferase